ncbi:MAG: cupredoxin family copper-binding protein [Nanoarchaeota archaeon]|nr:cupredoxin family copper-binding protein [Nanoarchaeota archaeon]
MGKFPIIVAIVVLVVGIISVAIFYMNDNVEIHEEISFESTELGIYKVNIQNFDYSPREVRIQRGESVVWTNKDSVGHTVTSSSGNEIDSPLLGLGQNYSKTFTEAGEYSYYCSPHPNMQGKVIVS